MQYNTISQGSILDACIFISYINDMSKASEVFSFFIYANDTTISSIPKEFKQNIPTENLKTLIYDELNTINEWLIV